MQVMPASHNLPLPAGRAGIRSRVRVAIDFIPRAANRDPSFETLLNPRS